MRDSSLVERKAKRETTNCVLHSLRSLGRWDRKKKSMVTHQSREKFTTRASGNTLRTPSTGSFSQGTRKGTDILADKGLAPFFFTIQCRRGIRQWRENFVSKTLHASACTENNSQKCLELTAAAATAAAARHHGEHRDTCSGAKPWQPQQIQQREYRTCWGRGKVIPSWSQNSRSSTRCSTEDQERLSNIQDGGWQVANWRPNWIDHQRFGKKWKSNMFSEAPRRATKKWEILNCTNWERFPKQYRVQRV